MYIIKKMTEIGFPKYDPYVISEFRRRMSMYHESGAKERLKKCEYNYKKYLKSFEEDFLSAEKFYWQDYFANQPEPEIQNKINLKKKCIFLTINFDNKNIKEKSYFTKILRKILSWKCITEAHAAFEFRNDDEQQWYGCHLHVVCTGSIKHIKQNAKRFKGKFTQLCGKYHTLIEYYYHPYYKEKVEYISGETFDEQKNEHKEKDKFYRKKLELEDIYKK